MDDFVERIYLEHAMQECDACYVALRAFNTALERKQSEDPFPHATAFVHHAAAVSRIFWPPGGWDKQAQKRAHRRGETLRKALSVPANHPVQGRTLRDHFEHFDERLDAWAERSKNRIYIEKLLGPRSAIGGDAAQDEDIIHHYDPATKIYAFCGKKFDVQALATGIDDLYAKISARLSELDREGASTVTPTREVLQSLLRGE